MENMEQIIKDCMIQYSGAVLQSRALVDVRDCLKPSARQIFYCMYTDKFTSNKPFKKTLKAIGIAARMFIHGDSSCEGIIMRAGQPFAMRYPLVEVEGSEGNLTASGNWSAPRYTASRLSGICDSLFQDIDKNTISEWRDNYDDTEKYPAVLPSKSFYNIVNGTFGIGTGLAASIPQFNLIELNNVLIKLLNNSDIPDNELIIMPDFATGALLLNGNEVKESLKYGSGTSCKLRSVINWNESEKCLVVTEIPYGVFEGCSSLQSVTMNSNMVTIGMFSFSKCSSLETVIIPSSVVLMDYSIFSECENLRTVEYYGTSDTAPDSYVFYGCDQLEYISVTTNYTDDTFCDIKVMYHWNVKSSGIIDGRWFVKDKSSIGDISELRQYFESKEEYVVGDLNTNELIESNTIVMQDMNIIVNKKDKIVIVEFDDGVREVNISEVANMISEATGIDIKKLIVSVEINEKGEVVRVLLYVDNDAAANTIVDMINGLDRDSSCNAGILCVTRRAYIPIQSEVLEMSYKHTESISVMILLGLVLIYTAFD